MLINQLITTRLVVFYRCFYRILSRLIHTVTINRWTGHGTGLKRRDSGLLDDPQISKPSLDFVRLFYGFFKSIISLVPSLKQPRPFVLNVAHLVWLFR